MKFCLFVVLLVLTVLTSSCQALQHWLFDASDYHLIESRNIEEDVQDERNFNWDDAEFDIWFEENDYD